MASLSLSFVLAIAAGPSFCANHPALTSCLESDCAAKTFCQTYLNKPTSTVTAIRTSQPVTTVVYTQGSVPTYVPSFVTDSAAVGTRTITATGSGTLQSTCSRTTLKPYTTTYTLPNGGATIVYTFTGPNVKRDLGAATPAPSTPSCVSRRPAATISAGCSCLSVGNPMTTVTSVIAAPTSTVSSRPSL